MFSGHFPTSLPHSGFIVSPDTTAPPIRAAANKDSRNLTIAATVFKLLHKSVDAGGENVKGLRLLVLLQLFVLQKGISSGEGGKAVSGPNITARNLRGK